MVERNSRATNCDKKNSRLMVLSPALSDAKEIHTVLARWGLVSEVITTIDELCRGIDGGADAAVVTCGILEPPLMPRLIDSLARQPVWSDFPLIVLMTPTARDEVWSEAHRIRAIASAILLERRSRDLVLVSAVEAALQARQRQYQVRDFLAAREGDVARLQYDAFHDHLTALPNRALFLDRLNQAIARCRRFGNAYAVMLLDLDDFKAINDTFGHLVGDELLREFGKRISALLRPVDTLARYGGDEFAVLLVETEKPFQVKGVAKRILGASKKPFVLEKAPVRVGTSIGIVFAEKGYSNTKQVLADADSARYEVKRKGKSAFSIFRGRG